MKTIVNSLVSTAAGIDPRTVKMLFAVLSFVLIIFGRPEGDGGVAL